MIPHWVRVFHHDDEEEKVPMKIVHCIVPKIPKDIGQYSGPRVHFELIYIGVTEKSPADLYD